MKIRLKQLRVDAGMTQTEIATAVGVTQPNYQRWESGSAPIPDAKLKKLAKVLETTAEAILGRYPPIEIAFYDDSAREEVSYYGEVAVHFLGGGEPLLLSISESAFSRLHRELQGDSAFLTIESLANQTVVFRAKAIADVYFSSEAYDDYGPEHGTYANHLDFLLPDDRDWEIVECISDDFGLEDFDPADVERVRDMIMITDEQYEKLVAAGHIKAEELEAERANNEARAEQIFSAARTVTYQLSTGQRRSVFIYDADNLYNAFYSLIDFGDDISAEDMVLLNAEGRHRVVFINKAGFDYVSIPTHQYNKGRIEAEASEIDA